MEPTVTRYLTPEEAHQLYNRLSREHSMIISRMVGLEVKSRRYKNLSRALTGISLAMDVVYEDILGL